MWKEKLGSYLLDISKYTITGIVIASLFKDFETSKPFVYGIGLLLSLLTLGVGLILTNKTKNENKKED